MSISPAVALDAGTPTAAWRASPPPRQSVADIAARLYPRAGMADRLGRLQFVLLSARHWTVMRDWLARLRTPPLGWLAGRHVHLFDKPLHPYLNRHLNPAQRLHWLGSHYEFLARRLSPARFRELHTTGRRLALLPDVEGPPAGLWLSYDRRQERCGELTLSLWSGRGAALVSISFTLLDRPPGRQRTLAIGRLQAAPGAIHPVVLRQIGAPAHGLGTSALSFAALQLLAATLGVRRLIAVGDAARIDRRSREHVSDGLWHELGAKPAGNGFVELPLEPMLREPSGAAADERGMWLGRYRVLERLRTDITQALAGAERRPRLAGA